MILYIKKYINLYYAVLKKTQYHTGITIILFTHIKYMESSIGILRLQLALSTPEFIK